MNTCSLQQFFLAAFAFISLKGLRLWGKGQLVTHFSISQFFDRFQLVCVGSNTEPRVTRKQQFEVSWKICNLLAGCFTMGYLEKQNIETFNLKIF